MIKKSFQIVGVFLVFLLFRSNACPGYSNPFIEQTCELNDIVRNCSEPALEGTIMKMACIPHYVDVSNSADLKTVCQNGTWNRPFLLCHPECGKRIAKAVTNILHGETMAKAEFPWNTIIYAAVIDNEIPIIYCLGSMITTKSVISAAHCFTNSIDGKPLPNKYYIGAGKINSTYNATEDGQQLRKVKDVIIPDTYNGIQGTFSRDIAILILEEPLIVTQKIQPICIDWDTKYEAQSLVDNNIGELVGKDMSDPSRGEPRIPLKVLEFHFINESYCINNVPDVFKKCIGLDKICTVGKSTCGEIGGGGLVFPITKGNIETYYIRGILSIIPNREAKDGSCNNSYNYTVHTKISTFLPFIKEVHKAYNIIT